MKKEIDLDLRLIVSQREALNIYKDALYRERSLLDRFLHEQAASKEMVMRVVANVVQHIASRLVDNSDATKVFDVILSLNQEQFESISKVLTQEQMMALVELLSRRVPAPSQPSGKIDAEFVEDKPAPKQKSRKKS